MKDAARRRTGEARSLPTRANAIAATKILLLALKRVQTPPLLHHQPPEVLREPLEVLGREVVLITTVVALLADRREAHGRRAVDGLAGRAPVDAAARRAGEDLVAVVVVVVVVAILVIIGAAIIIRKHILNRGTSTIVKAVPVAAAGVADASATSASVESGGIELKESDESKI